MCVDVEQASVSVCVSISVSIRRRPVQASALVQASVPHLHRPEATTLHLYLVRTSTVQRQRRSLYTLYIILYTWCAPPPSRGNDAHVCVSYFIHYTLYFIPPPSRGHDAHVGVRRPDGLADETWSDHSVQSTSVDYFTLLYSYTMVRP